MTTPLPEHTIEAFIAHLKSHHITRCWWVFDHDKGEVTCSHAEPLQPITDWMLNEIPDYDKHEGIFIQVGPDTGILQAIFVHHTNRGQAAGGVRFWFYDHVRDFLFDGIRLSKGMTYKNALAGLWWGGGKAVIAVPEGVEHNEKEFRKALYREFGRFVTSLNGCYVTAEDVGTKPEDMGTIFSTTRFTTCIPTKVGGSGNPSKLTGIGVARGMEGALDALGMNGLKDKTIAVQGAGFVARYMTEELLKKGVARVMLYDIFDEQLMDAKEFLGDDKRVSYHEIEKDDMAPLFADADVVSPCATGGVLNDDTIGKIKARVVCGGANNQLKEEEKHAQMLHEAGVAYVPDFLANRMGIVNCANEQYGYVDDDPAIHRHLDREWSNAVYVLARRVISETMGTEVNAYQKSLAIAQENMEQPHPIWGNRSRLIIQSLLKNGWAE